MNTTLTGAHPGGITTLPSALVAEAPIKRPRSFRRSFRLAVVALSLGVHMVVRAQAPGTVDRYFNPGSTTGREVLALTVLPDGRAYVGGSFRVLGGTFCPQLARLNPGGSVDPSFSVGSGFDNLVINSTREMTNGGWVSSIAVRGDGSLLVAGFFNRANGIARNGLARLHPDGSLDAGFDPAARCAGGGVSGVATLPGDQVLIRGGFTSVWDQPRVGLARLQPDCTLDRAFDASAALQGQSFRNVIPLRDGKFLVVGNNRLFRLKPDGSLDAGFAPATIAGGSFRSVTVQAREFP